MLKATEETPASNDVETVRVLVVDDEPAIRDAVTYTLKQEGYAPLTAGDGDTALQLFRIHKPHLIILDVMLPSGSGLEICRLLRQSGNTVPIIMLTARVTESDRVQGLEMGADDYLVKPFGMRELMARVRALLRRGGPAAPLRDMSGSLSTTAQLVSSALKMVLDNERREVRIADKLLSLSRKEFDLLSLLVTHPGRVFDRQTLLDRVWGEDAYVDDRTVDVHIRWLREKIEPTPGKPVHLLTIRGVGYKFQG